ncbi:SGNH/GDSL hydrolase family protein [Levilactobacillus bambusae]|uniref:Lysophospholipase n=1 Tax=Levilactobacillus bambusae TaxID=2024736 RepID=A0A2V1N1B6_9LACO|nr:SGNH/GDSL hydrolase family protein [Levilactobacillus bambusae]PWG00813.1 lysophospholipase [Levilactobacillus bambusae]
MRFKENFAIAGIFVAVIGVVFGALLVFHPGRTTNQVTSKTEPTHVQAATLTALGDSLTYGTGDPTNAGGYVSRIKTKEQKAHQIKLTTHNEGKAGDRSDQIDTRLLQTPSIQKNVRTANVITLTVGGNDLLQTLMAHSSMSADSDVTQTIAKNRQQYQTRLTKLMRDIRHYNPNAPIFVFSIYNPLYVYFANVSAISTAVSEWNSTTQAVLNQQSNTHFVSIDRQLSHGQYQTTSEQQKLVAQDKRENSGTVNLSEVEAAAQKNQNTERNTYLSTTDHFHPNSKGYDVMANQLFQAMSKHDAWSIKK